MTSAPDLHESVHAGSVLRTLREAVTAAGGWLPFDDYMRIALYAPGLGYYSAGATKLGAGGDFTTAPEISPLFGQCLARHCAEVLAAVEGGDILELGAGTGRLAFDVLTALAAQHRLPARYRIVEISADLRERQRKLLASLPAELAARVEWLDAPPSQPWRGALLANEVLDALPFKRIRREEGAWKELGVAINGAGLFVWKTLDASPMLRAQIDGSVPEDLCDGYATELCPLLQPWIAEVTASLQQGVALFIDYGLPRPQYYHPDRAHGTLRCHYRQRAHADPFAHPGMEDITAWVDFTEVAEGAEAADLWVLGFSTQTAALLGLGIEAAIAAAPDEPTRIRRASEARQLLMPTEMGETFKMMALGRDCDAPLSAFGLQDLRRSL
jgi:SAM-dependent MidA family methyltransferase